MAKLAQKSQKTAKRGPGKPFQPGQSGNPGGRPKGGASITGWVRDFLNMTSDEAANACATYSREFRGLHSGDLPLAGLVAARVVASLVSEPTPGLLGHVLDRTEGEVGSDAEGAKRLTIRVIYDDARDRDDDTPTPPASRTSNSSA